MINNDQLKRVTRAALILLLVSEVFCISAVFIHSNRKNRDENEDIVLPETDMLREMAVSDTFTVKSNMVADNVDDVRKVIVLDAGHGKGSSFMSDEEKADEGYIYNEARGEWGEWRHYKDGTFYKDCEGSGCTGTAPENGSCWYRLENGDRDTEPEINLSNAEAARKYLEYMGYEVRMTRTSSGQNPSMNKRVSYCFPNNDISASSDASAYVCIHSNAGGGHGTSYISLGEAYTQAGIPKDYTERSNRLAERINSKISSASGLECNPPIGGEEYLILFNKCPVPIAYLEIGFFDSVTDLEVLRSSSDEIGRAIAEGIDEFFND